MAAPTLLDYAESTYTGTGTTETTDDLNWNAAGDRIVVLGATEVNSTTIAVPTGTGLTLAAMTGTPTNTGSSCKAYAWEDTAAGDGNSVVSATVSANQGAGISCWAFSNVDSVQNPVVLVNTAAVVSMTVVADSSVVMILADFDATADVAVTTSPVGGTIREATNNSGRFTVLVVEWHNQAAGTRNYGVTAWGSTGTISKVAVEVRGAAGGGPIVVNVGQAVETDTATTVTRRKTRAVGQASEADTATAAARLKLRTVGQAAELDTATAIGRRKTRAIGQATETNTATVVSRRKLRAVGQAVELDTAGAVTVPGVIVVNVGQAIELDSAGAMGRLKRRALGQAVEMDTAATVARLKVRAVGQAAELDSANAVTPSGGEPPVPLVPDRTVSLAVPVRAVDLAAPVSEVDLSVTVRAVSI